MGKIKLKINGKEVEIKEGMTVLDAAQKVGIYIPALCSHSSLSPYGGCRLCIVEIEGVEGLPTACTTPVEDGMVVHTETKTLQEMRRRILELILSEHPYTCLVCDRKERCEDYQGTIRKVGVTTGCKFCPKYGNCELQKVVEYLGMEKVDFPITYRNLPAEVDDPFFDRDYNLCILCGRCVRVCEEVRGDAVISFINRGSKVVVGTAFGKTHLESDCEFCGACVDVCPTGALSELGNKWEGEPERSVSTTCPYCGVGCTLKFNVKGNRVIGVTPDPKGNVNKGQLCVRGRFCITEVVHSPNRLKVPLIRKDGNFVESSWEEALDLLASRLREYKGEQFAFVASPHCTDEDNYIFQKFTRVVMDTNNIAVASQTPLEKIGECNLMGARIMGCLADYLPGYEPLADKDARERVEALWQCSLPSTPGLDYPELSRAIETKVVKALYLAGEIPFSSRNFQVASNKGLKFLIVQSVFPTPTCEFAHVVLPAASFAEIDGTFINIEGRRQRMRKAIEPLYESRPDWWIVCEIAKRLGVEGFGFRHPREIRAEIKVAEPLSRRIRTDSTLAGVKPTPMEIKPSDGFYEYRGGSLIEEVKGLKEVVNHWRKR